MIDAAHIKGLSARRRSQKRNQSLARTKGGLNTKLHLAADAHGLPVLLFVTASTCEFDVGDPRGLFGKLPH